MWFNSTHMHFRTHAKPESKGQSGRWQSEYHDTMIDHDRLVGELLGLVDELGVSENTIVIYSTDSGPHMNSWPDAGMTPFRGEKNSNWEGAYRVPAVVRWPGRIKPGDVFNGIVSHNDWFPTLLAAAGVTDIADQLLEGADLGGVTYQVHLDGSNQLPNLTGETDESPRRHFFYVSDDDLTAVRFDNWKLVFLEQRAAGTLRVGGALHPPAGPEDLQSAHGSLRAGGHHLQHLLRLDPRPHLGLRIDRRASVDADRAPAPLALSPVWTVIARMARRSTAIVMALIYRG